MSENRVIGIQNRLPWRLPADQANFRKITKGKKFIMGRKSYEAEDKLLSEVGNVIVTHQKNYPVAYKDTIAISIEQAIGKLRGQSEVFVLGGAEIFAQSIVRADYLYITLVHSKFIGDAFFPEIDTDLWQAVRQSNFKADDENQYDYSFIKYRRIAWLQ